jgi:hypothetical protein
MPLLSSIVFEADPNHPNQPDDRADDLLATVIAGRLRQSFTSPAHLSPALCAAYEVSPRRRQALIDQQSGHAINPFRGLPRADSSVAAICGTG